MSNKPDANAIADRTVEIKVEEAIYTVGIHFDHSTKDTLESRIKRIMLQDVKMSKY